MNERMTWEFLKASLFINFLFALAFCFVKWSRKARRKRRKNVIKIKISYERPEELQKVLERLAPNVKNLKVARKQDGRFLKAYVTME